MNENVQNYLTTIAENQQGVYDVGIEQGKKQEYNDFWDKYGKTGIDFSYRFAGPGWNDNTFRPNKNLVVSYANMNYMFSQSAITDLEGLLQNLGVVLNTTNGLRADYMFAYCSKLTTVPILNLSNALNNRFTQLFYRCGQLHTIRKLILPTDNRTDTNLYTSAFTGCSSLANIEVEGLIVQTISFADCPLTIESIKSIITCLKDFTDTSDAGKYTVTFKRYDSSTGYTAFEELETEGATAEYNGQPCTWAELVAYKKWNLA